MHQSKVFLRVLQELKIVLPSIFVGLLLGRLFVVVDVLKDHLRLHVLLGALAGLQTSDHLLTLVHADLLAQVKIVSSSFLTVHVAFESFSPIFNRLLEDATDEDALELAERDHLVSAERADF